MIKSLPSNLKLLVLTTIVLCAFAANSLFGRWALNDGGMGAVSYTILRLSAGSVVLLFLSSWQNVKTHGSLISAFALLAYASCFSFAYLSLPTGIGALIVFAAVQFTMIGAGLLFGERLRWPQWLGLLIASVSFVLLLLPGSEAPNFLGALIMIGSGVGWGIYSLRGRGSTNAIDSTAGNFLRASSIAIVFGTISLFFRPEVTPHLKGIGLAILSGAVTSALAYSLWYAVITELGAIKASVVQLLVPPIAILAGVLILGEKISLTFVALSGFLLAGVLMVIIGKRTKSSRANDVVNRGNQDPTMGKRAKHAKLND